MTECKPTAAGREHGRHGNRVYVRARLSLPLLYADCYASPNHWTMVAGAVIQVSPISTCDTSACTEPLVRQLRKLLWYVTVPETPRLWPTHTSVKHVLSKTLTDRYLRKA